jgi:hypothetical protein
MVVPNRVVETERLVTLPPRIARASVPVYDDGGNA